MPHVELDKFFLTDSKFNSDLNNFAFLCIVASQSINDSERPKRSARLVRQFEAVFLSPKPFTPPLN